jgi:hypothetical protein
MVFSGVAGSRPAREFYLPNGDAERTDQVPERRFLVEPI